MNIAVHHHQKRKQHFSNKKRMSRYVDDVIYAGGVLGVIIFIPQLIMIWTEKNISGVSLLSWLGMFVASSFWLMYGFVHKAKPIIFTNMLAALVQLMVIIGILVHV
jgi:uncharacterized protein with PQ loop repeat